MVGSPLRSLNFLSRSLTFFLLASVQEYVFQRKGVTDELCELSVRRIIALIYSAVKSNLFFSRGKEALVEKFKNSCIMEERESWRPKIFYSEPGPKQGLLEPFPAATHNRRKERSALNRGALFVSGSQHLHNASNREQRPQSGGEEPPSDDHRSPRHSASTPTASLRLPRRAHLHQAGRSTRQVSGP